MMDLEATVLHGIAGIVYFIKYFSMLLSVSSAYASHMEIATELLTHA